MDLLKKFNINKLVYFEIASEVIDAIEREKQLKGWLRRKKVALIESVNPMWDDLSERWTK
jgi:putative endonuclease